jgi:tetratricopeptide (TPR) repeat protein
MSLLIKALNKAEEAQAELTKVAQAELTKVAAAEKTKKTQAIELELEASTASKLPNKISSNTSLAMELPQALASEVFAEPTKAPVSAKTLTNSTQTNSSPTSTVNSKPQTSSNQSVINQAAAKNAANVFSAKGTEAKTDSTRLALIAGAGLIALLGMGLYFYQFVDNSPPIVVPPRPLEQIDSSAQANPPVQTAAIDSPAVTEPEPAPVIEPSLPAAEAMLVETRPAQTSKKTKKLQDSMFAIDDNETTETSMEAADVAEKNAVVEDSLAENEEDVTRLQASFSSRKVGKKSRKSKNNAAIASESASISVTKSTTESGVNPILMSAYEAYNAGKDADAQKLYKQVLKRDIQNVDALLGLGAIAARQGRSADANSWYSKVLEVDPRNSIARSSMLDNQSQGNEINNETSLKNMLAKQPNDANLHVALGNLYAEQNQWPAAQQAYFDAYSLNKTADNAYNLAVSLDQMGKPKLALPYYQRALEQASDASNIDKAALQARIAVIQ